jgi:hypothetical protein
LEILKKEREKRIHGRLANRALALQQLIPTLPTALRLKAELELSQLLVLHRQRALRTDLMRDLMWATSFRAVQCDPSTFTRQRKVPNTLNTTLDSNTRFAEGSKRYGYQRSLHTHTHQRVTDNACGHADRPDKRHEFVMAVVAHAHAFRAFHAAQQKEQKKVCSLVLKYHTNKARREQAQREREQKERLRALRVC